MCTSSSAAAFAYLSLPLSLSVSLFRGTSHNIAISVLTLLFFRSYNEVFVQTAFIAYFPSFWQVLFCDVTTGLILCTPLLYNMRQIDIFYRGMLRRSRRLQIFF